MSETKISNCRSCGGKIIWHETIGGKRIPLNYRRVKSYIILENPQSTTEQLGYISHFITCPDANTWSKKK